MMGARLLLGALSLFFLILNTRANGLDPRALSIDDIPPCGIQCLFLAVPQSGCSFSDIQCQCQNEDLAYTLSACLLANCTMQDTLGTAVVQASLCNLPNESRTRQLLLCTIIIFPITLLFVGLRVAGKIVAKRVTPDDYILVAAMVLAFVPIGSVLAMTHMGFGEHLWNLQPGQLKLCLQFFFIAWTTYVIILGLIKVSLIMFYLQIFISRTFHIVAYVVMSYIVLSALIFFFLSVFACSPIELFWDRDLKGKCLDINAIAYGNSGSTIAQDIMILVLPMASIGKLRTNKLRKFAVGIMFAVGAFGCVTTILRLHSLLNFKISIDPTWDYVPVTIWTQLELATGFICVSLPSVRILLTMIFPRNFLSWATSMRSKSGSTPHNNATPDGKRSARKGVSWLHIPTQHNDTERTGLEKSKVGIWSSGSRSQAFAKFGSVDMDMDTWPPRSQDALRTQVATQSQEALQPPLPRPTPTLKGYLRDLGVVKSPEPVADRTEFSNSRASPGTYITALPRLGVLPDGGYSVDLDQEGEDMQHLHPPV